MHESCQYAMLQSSRVPLSLHLTYLVPLGLSQMSLAHHLAHSSFPNTDAAAVIFI